VEPVGPDLTRIDEPHVHELLRANIWHLRGRDRVADAYLAARQSVRKFHPVEVHRAAAC
jgi:hypothetical protein